jgi:hypothetical protein
LKYRRRLLLLSVLLIQVLTARGHAQRSKDVRLTLHGVTFSIPPGFTQLPAATNDEVIFLFGKKSKEGVFVAVPKSHVDEAQINQLVEAALAAYFPKEEKTYKWVNPISFDKVSRFETGNIRSQGYNKHDIVVFEFRRVVFENTELVVGNIFEASKGKDAEEMSKTGGRSSSMSACNAEVHIIFSVTGEKPDPSRLPCELVAVAPGS